MKLFLQLTSLALFGAATGAQAHELIRGSIELADDMAIDKKPDFFPHEDKMDEVADSDADEDEDALNQFYYGGNRNNKGRNPNKTNSAQKRQIQRDRRRSMNNPNRSQDEERRERNRKYDQSKSRGRDCIDPSDPGCGRRDFTNKRERARQADCDRNGRNCNRHRVIVDPNPRRRQADRNCIRRCRGNRDCERNCMALERVEDVEYVADFLGEFEDFEFIADFLRDIDFDAEDPCDPDVIFADYPPAQRTTYDRAAENGNLKTRFPDVWHDTKQARNRCKQDVGANECKSLGYCGED